VCKEVRKFILTPVATWICHGETGLNLACSTGAMRAMAQEVLTEWRLGGFYIGDGRCLAGMM
jgi:hypothetical protein